jgi:hypothetical protein
VTLGDKKFWEIGKQEELLLLHLLDPHKSLDRA